MMSSRSRRRNKKYSTPYVNDESDAEDGKPDSRKTSRGQRYTFEQNKHMFDQELVKRVELLMNPQTKLPGKQKEINQIINSCVSRRAQNGQGVAIKERTVTKVNSHTIEDREKEQIMGKGWFSIVGSEYAGNEELAIRAKEAGELVQNESNGKWYVGSHTVTRSNIKVKGHETRTDFDALKDENLLQAMLAAEEELGAESLEQTWLQVKPVVKAAAKKQAGQEDFAMMQETGEAKNIITCMEI